MTSDLGIHLFLLLLSAVGLLSALLSLHRDPVLRCRLILPTNTSGPYSMLIAVVGRRTIRKHVRSSGKFRLTIPSGSRAMIKIVLRKQVVRTMSVSHRAGHVERLWTLRQQFNLGDIVLEERDEGRNQMQLFVLQGSAVVVRIGAEPTRPVPSDHQLIDNSSHWRGGSTRPARIA